MEPEVGGKVWREGGKSAWRIVDHGSWEGEKSVLICRPGRWKEWRRRLRIDPKTPHPAETETIPVANLIKHHQGWWERCFQLDLLDPPFDQDSAVLSELTKSVT